MKDNVQNLLVVTPYYPIKHRQDLFEDTKAIYYLLAHKPKDIKLTIIHVFNHSFRNMHKHFRSVVPYDKNYNKHLYKDDLGNDLLFLENIFFIPSRSEVSRYFQSNIIDIVKQYMIKEEVSPENIVVHFPTIYSSFKSEILCFNRKIAVLHSFDIKKIRKTKSIRYWTEFFMSFDAIGFRSYIIEREFKSLISIPRNTFICLSGVPRTFLQEGYDLQKKRRNSLLFVGRLTATKNAGNILKALSRMNNKNDLNFDIIGDGNERARLEKQTNNLQLNKIVRFLGKVSRDEVFRKMQESEIFILISKKETLGLVYLEAMAAGCIVIATKGQGLDGVIINGENGFLVDCEDIQEIATVINFILKLSEDEKESIIINAKRTVESMGDEEMSKCYFREILNIESENNET